MKLISIFNAFRASFQHFPCYGKKIEIEIFRDFQFFRSKIVCKPERRYNRGFTIKLELVKGISELMIYPVISLKRIRSHVTFRSEISP